MHDGSSLPDKMKSISPIVTTTINVISVPPKIWRSKPKNKYKSIICADVDERFYVYKYCGKSMTISPS